MASIEMSKFIPFLYTVEELNRLGQVRSRLYTRDGFLALADWLLKTHVPLGFPPGVKVAPGGVSIEAIGHHMPLEDRSINLEASYQYEGSNVRRLSIKTSIVTLDLDEGYTPKTVGCYQTQEYAGAVLKIKKRLEAFACHQHDVAYLVAQFAVRDRQHPFWNPNINRNKLSM